MDALHILFSVIVIAAIAGILIYFLILKPRKEDSDDSSPSNANSLKIDFCIGTYVNSNGETKKAIGARIAGTSIYYCVKYTVHDLDYDFSPEQIGWFKQKFVNCTNIHSFQSLVYYANAPVEPLVQNI